MFDRHNHPVVTLGHHFECGRQFFPHGEERVVAGGGEFAGQTGEDAAAEDADVRGFAVHRVGEHAEFAAEVLHHALEP